MIIRWRRAPPAPVPSLSDRLPLAVAWAAVAVVAAGVRSEPLAVASTRTGVAPAAVSARASVEESDEPVTSSSCERELKLAYSEPALPGTPKLDAKRPVVLLYAKAEPTVFVRTPLPPAHGSEVAEAYRTLLSTTSSPWSQLERLWSVFSANPELGRAVLLREGYLYAEKPELAFALVDLVAAQQLFSEKQIWIHRGERLLTAERDKAGRYVFVDGPERGQRVKLLLFDRIGTGEPPPPLHRDFRALRARLGFDRVKIVRIGEHNIIADLRYGSVWVRSVLRAKGAELSLACEAPNPEYAPMVKAVRAEHERREKVLGRLRRGIVESISDGLPFDEPLTEYGQQDGKLRRRWHMAYSAGQTSYEFNKDKYEVYNLAGRPLVPQVCVDFIFDTFERASGTWWRPRGEKRERVMGGVDFKTFEDETMRRATSVIDYANQHPEWFEMDTLAENERVPFKLARPFADFLVAQADRFRAGDVVLIRGYAPWDKPWKPKIMHFHSFFVYETDPLTGQPLALAGNPGRPLLQTWQFEAFRTPERSIWYRIRPKLAWLESILGARSDVSPVPAPAPLTVELRDRSTAVD
jgi:hypothetical protein